KKNAGSVFITDERLPNPYRGLPRYWTEELAAIAALDLPAPSAPAFPSGGVSPVAESATTSAMAPPAVFVSASAGLSPTILVPMSPRPSGLFRRLVLGFRAACRPRAAPLFASFAGP